MAEYPEKPDESRVARDDATVVYTDPLDVQKQLPKAELVCLETPDERFKSLRIPLVDTEQTIGRDSENSTSIEYSKISRRHARILARRGVWEIEDLKSTNGVYVNDERITRATPLTHGDIVRIGPLSFRYALEEAPTSHADSPLGAGGTLYAGHPAVAAFLTPQEKSDDVLRQAPPRPSPRESEANTAPALRKKVFPLRYLLVVLLVAGLAGGGYLYSGYINEREIEALVAEYSAAIRKFLDSYEGEGLPFSKQSQEEELDAVRNIAARVDLATGQHPASLQLKELQTRLLFLAFERKLRALLIEGRVQDAFELVEDTKAKLPALSGRDTSRGDERNGVEEVSDLLELAVVIVKFKQFRQRFPDPAKPELEKPAPYYMREMQILKDELVRHKKENHLPLSVTYTYFQRMVMEVDEHDLRLLNRWKDVLKRQSP